MEMQAIVTILFLVFLEGILSFDNALALAAMVKHLPPNYQKKALTYGMWGAFLFRFLSLFALTYIMQSHWIRIVGGAYLIVLAARHFGGPEPEEAPKSLDRYRFWKMIVAIELTDIAFSSDSILASVAVSDQLWVVFTGGVLGIIMMRLASILFIRLIEIFPKLERTAYLLVSAVGTKLLCEGLNSHIHFDNGWAFWIFWSVMAVCVLSGFTTRKNTTVICSKPTAVS